MIARVVLSSNISSGPRGVERVDESMSEMGILQQLGWLSGEMLLRWPVSIPESEQL
jgi:hypothetical protein